MIKVNLFARPQTRAEELANSLSHGAGLAAAVVGAVVLLAAAAQRGNPAFTAGVGVYAVTMVLLYLASTLYHALPDNRAKRVLQVCDHAAIFLFIAGTYTPFTLGVLRGTLGWALFGLVWGLAAVGVAFKIIGGAARYPILSTAVYVGMGWSFVLAGSAAWRAIDPAGLMWLLAGGLAYTVGVGFFIGERVRFSHFVWHLFVLAGTTFHFFAVLWHAA